MEVSASYTSTMLIILATSGICSPLRPSGYPVPSHFHDDILRPVPQFHQTAYPLSCLKENGKYRRLSLHVFHFSNSSPLNAEDFLKTASSMAILPTSWRGAERQAFLTTTGVNTSEYTGSVTR